jgi:flagellar L-ring protein precursor FlgH
MHMIGRWSSLIAIAACLAGCEKSMPDLGREPAMSAVGSGLDGTESLARRNIERLADRATGSGPGDLAARLFQDPRAHRVGDLVTVKIAINDSASFDNKTDRSRVAKSDYGLTGNVANDVVSKSLSASAGLSSDTSSNGQGNTTRSEKIELLVAALVTGVLPNGNLVLTGSQEVRVSHELRLLSIGGVIRPQDINRDNTITYDKIAEARIAYGGKGRLTEVQQPSYGQQFLDQIMPF